MLGRDPSDYPPLRIYGKVGRGNSGHGIIRGNSGHFNVATGKKHPFILASSEL